MINWPILISVLGMGIFMGFIIIMARREGARMKAGKKR